MLLWWVEDSPKRIYTSALSCSLTIMKKVREWDEDGGGERAPREATFRTLTLEF